MSLTAEDGAGARAARRSRLRPRRAHLGAVGEEGGFGVEICQKSEKKRKKSAVENTEKARGGLN